MNHFAAIVFKCLQLFDHCFDGVCLDRLERTSEVVLFLLFHFYLSTTLYISLNTSWTTALNSGLSLKNALKFSAIL